jgi:hypothetical protein
MSIAHAFKPDAEERRRVLAYIDNAKVIPISKPLGHDDEAYEGPQVTAAAIVAKSISNLTEAQLDAPATFEFAIATTIETFTDAEDLRDKLSELRKEIADGQAGMRADLEKELAGLKTELTEARVSIARLEGAQAERSRAGGIIRP